MIYTILKPTNPFSMVSVPTKKFQDVDIPLLPGEHATEHRHDDSLIPSSQEHLAAPEYF